MTSGLSLAISVKLMPSASENWIGALSEPKPAPSFSSAASFHGVEPLLLPPHSFLGTPTGTTPSAMATSSLTQDTVTTRLGCSLMVVSPKTCLMVTGKCALVDNVALASEAVETGPVEHAVRESAVAARTAVALPAVLSRERRVVPAAAPPRTACGPEKRGKSRNSLGE